MKKTWLFQLIYSIIPIFIIVIFVISIMFYFTMKDIVSQEVRQANLKLTQQVMQTIDNKLVQLDQKLLQEIQSNKIFAQFFEEDDAFNNAQVNYELNKWLLIHPEIENVYLYRQYDHMVINADVMVPFDWYEQNDDFRKQYVNRQLSSKWSGIREITTFSDRHRKEVVTLVRQYPLIAAMKGLVVLNVDAGFLKKTIHEMSDLQISVIHIKDGNNQSMTPEYDDSRYSMLTEIRSEYTGWHYYGGVERFPVSTLKITNLWILGGILVIFCGFAGMIYFIRKSYTPLDRMLNHVRKHMAAVDPPNVQTAQWNEFRFIEKAFDNLVDSTNNYREQVEVLQAYQQSKRFREVLEGEYHPDKQRLNEGLGLPPDASYIVAVVEIDRYNDFAARFTPGDQQLLKFVLNDVTLEIVRHFALQARAEWFDDHQLTVLVHHADTAVSPQALEQLLRPAFHRLLAWIHENLTFTATIGAGEPVRKTENVPMSWDGALETLKYKLSLGSDHIIFYKDIAKKGTFVLQDGMHTITAAALAVCFGKEDWKERLEQVFRFIKNHKMTREEAGPLLQFLLYSIEKEMLNLPDDFQQRWHQEAVPVMERTLRNSEMLEDLKAQFESCLATYAASARAYHEQSRQSAWIRQIRNDLEDHYADPDMSLTYLGDKYNLSVKYVSQQFKQQYGENFIDVLTRLRILKAKQLLTDSDDSIQDIGSRVGYTNYLTFYRAFKKVTLFSPGDFRDQASAERSTSDGSQD